MGSNTISNHRNNRDNPCEIDKLLDILTGLKKDIEAILYCRLLGSPNMFQQLKETGILILDVKRRLTSTRKRNNPDFSAELAAVHPQNSTDNKLIRTVVENKDNLRILAKKKKLKSKNRPSQKKKREAQRTLGSF